MINGDYAVASTPFVNGPTADSASGAPANNNDHFLNVSHVMRLPNEDFIDDDGVLHINIDEEAPLTLPRKVASPAKFTVDHALSAFVDVGITAKEAHFLVQNAHAAFVAAEKASTCRIHSERNGTSCELLQHKLTELKNYVSALQNRVIGMESEKTDAVRLKQDAEAKLGELQSQYDAVLSQRMASLTATKEAQKFKEDYESSQTVLDQLLKAYSSLKARYNEIIKIANAFANERDSINDEVTDLSVKLKRKDLEHEVRVNEFTDILRSFVALAESNEITLPDELQRKMANIDAFGRSSASNKSVDEDHIGCISDTEEEDDLDEQMEFLLATSDTPTVSNPLPEQSVSNPTPKRRIANSRKKPTLSNPLPRPTTPNPLPNPIAEFSPEPTTSNPPHVPAGFAGPRKRKQHEVKSVAEGVNQSVEPAEKVQTRKILPQKTTKPPPAKKRKAAPKQVIPKPMTRMSLRNVPDVTANFAMPPVVQQQPCLTSAPSIHGKKGATVREQQEKMKAKNTKEVIEKLREGAVPSKPLPKPTVSIQNKKKKQQEEKSTAEQDTNAAPSLFGEEGVDPSTDEPVEDCLDPSNEEGASHLTAQGVEEGEDPSTEQSLKQSMEDPVKEGANPSTDELVGQNSDSPAEQGDHLSAEEPPVKPIQSANKGRKQPAVRVQTRLSKTISLLARRNAKPPAARKVVAKPAVAPKAAAKPAVARKVVAKPAVPKVTRRSLRNVPDLTASFAMPPMANQQSSATSAPSIHGRKGATVREQQEMMRSKNTKEVIEKLREDAVASKPLPKPTASIENKKKQQEESTSEQVVNQSTEEVQTSQVDDNQPFDETVDCNP